MRRRRTMTVVVVLLIILCGEDVRADYSVRLATTALYYAKAAYCKAEAISSWTCVSCASNPGMQKVRVFTNAKHSTQAFVGVNDSMIVVSFRGTRDINNWLHNLDFSLSVHTGWLRWVSCSRRLPLRIGVIVGGDAGVPTGTCCGERNRGNSHHWAQPWRRHGYNCRCQFDVAESLVPQCTEGFAVHVWAAARGKRAIC
ncbi:putative lipase [Trypanosoma cruzi]|uniref:Putative lipase n=1 Tax=Trypanosoma cruzi TaxID=5693 RepID=A0A2V2US12_TRYCR|nr:putative lipase [Trypanosoma cruzi]